MVRQTCPPTQYPLHQMGADTKLTSNLQHAHAAPVEGTDSFFHLLGAHTPAFLISTPGAILAIPTAKSDAGGPGSGHAGIDAIAEQATLELGKDTAHLEHRPARRRRGVEGLLMQIKIAPDGLELIQKSNQILQAAPKTIRRPGRDQVHLARCAMQEARSPPSHRKQDGPAVLSDYSATWLFDPPHGPRENGRGPSNVPRIALLLEYPPKTGHLGDRHCRGVAGAPGMNRAALSRFRSCGMKSRL
jgi:hypothetical protein